MKKIRVVGILMGKKDIKCTYSHGDDSPDILFNWEGNQSVMAGHINSLSGTQSGKGRGNGKFKRNKFF